MLMTQDPQVNTQRHTTLSPLVPREIIELESDLVNKIAAGEVIERPASVVKELVENALDAGATRIDISLKDGGRKLIQVSDDGCGMTAEQLDTAIRRHTTSKIRAFDDLSKLSSMGFRGEALASICSVARVSLASRVAGDDPASEIVIDAGQILERRVAARERGTTVAVKFLFHQVPARLKFLRSPETETGHVADVVTRLALAHSEVDMTLTQDGKNLLDAREAGDERRRIAAILGAPVSEQLYDFFGEAPGMRLSGYLGHPQMARSQRGSSYFFVNGRAVFDKVLWHAAMEAYRDLLMKGKYPVLILHLEIDPAEIDVNVHPAKAEVRFQQSQRVHGFVYQTLRERLKQAPWLRTQAPPAVGPAIQDSLQSWSERYFSSSQSPPQSQSSSRSYSTSPSLSQSSSSVDAAGLPSHGTSSIQRRISFGTTPYADLQPIGQLLGTYILCEGRDHLVLIDQHAAHERIGFEKLLLEFQKTGVQRAALLIPETFDVRPSDAAILKNYLEALAEYGFEIDFFGGNTFVIKAVPALLQGKLDVAELLHDVLADVRETGELVALKDRWHHVLATMACHAQIRAHHHLELAEMRALLAELEKYQFTDFCPHGRPVSIEVTRTEIEKWFKRTL